MHVAIDASDLTTDRWDGTTVYARHVLPALAATLAGDGIAVTLYASAPLRVPVPERDNLRVTIVPGKRFWTQTRLSRVLFSAKPELLFLPIQTVPLYRPRDLRVVATVHDLDFLDYPETYTFKNRLLLRWFSRVVARNATHLIAVSHTTKQEVMRRYGRQSQDITVVYHGMDRRFRRAAEHERASACAEVQQRYRIPARPILFVGALQPRKNIQGLVDAYDRVRSSGCTEHLVIVTGGGWKQAAVRGRIERSPYRQDVHLLEQVPRDDLPGMYWNASVFVLPSFSEGFGMPIVEAMASGTPVVTSNVSALAEVAGDAALTVDPKDSARLAEAIARVLKDAEMRHLYIERGLRRAAKFSWERCISDTAAVIEAVLKR